jgi:hypothetical protein
MRDSLNVEEIPSIFPVIRESDNGEQFAADCPAQPQLNRLYRTVFSHFGLVEFFAKSGLFRHFSLLSGRDGSSPNESAL